MKMKMNMEALHELELKLDEFTKENGDFVEQDSIVKKQYCFGCEGSCTTHCVGSCVGDCSRKTR